MEGLVRMRQMKKTRAMKLKRKQIEDEYKALVQAHMGAGPVSFLD